MTYPCPRCNRDDGYPICAGDERCQRTDGAAYAAASERSSPDWHAGYRAGLAAGRACAAAVQPVPDAAPHPLDLMQAGFNNVELRAHWDKKLPGVEPTDRELSAFAVGTEVGFARARDLERQDWSRVWHALARAGLHPGRTDDRAEAVIDRLVAERNAAIAAARAQQPAP